MMDIFDKSNTPLISIIWNARGKTDVAKHNILALQAQAHQNYELLLIGNGAFTDEACKDFNAAAAEDKRIRIIPSAAASSGEALLSALRHCRGDYIGICPTEGNFLPHTLQNVAAAFEKSPEVGLVCGTDFLIDAFGVFLEQVDIVTLLLTSYRPFLPAAFFRREALIDAGLHHDNWLCESIDLELATRIVGYFGIKRIGHRLVHCPNAASLDDGLPKNVSSAVEERLELLSRIFSIAGFWGSNEALFLESKANQVSNLWAQFRALGLPDIEHLATTQLKSVAQHYDVLLAHDHRVLRNLHRLFCVRSHNLGLLSGPLQKLLTFAFRSEGRISVHLPYQIWHCALGIGSWLKRKVIALTLPQSLHHSEAPPREEMLADVYAIAASRYEARGQIDLALEMWAHAEPLRSKDIDGLAGQAMIKSPTATNETIAAFQRRWAARHALPPLANLRMRASASSERKIRIGYHCSFMETDTIRYMMRNVFLAHDRSKFEVYGYAPRAIPEDIAKGFDVTRNIGSKPRRLDLELPTGPPAISDLDFVKLVRNDQIDVLVELSGFSMGNRFAAMGARCAPVQVSFLNHTGSSQVPNIDYVISDEVSIPSDAEDQKHYSEQILRLPGCFFCFDYRGSDTPPLSPPPSATRGYTTFGCFGYGGKLNLQLIKLWAQLLRHIPKSVLHLQNTQFHSYDCRQFVSHQFKSFGISNDRLTLAKGVGRSALLEAYNHIDISLDTWPYCGGNTVAESLWMGVPIVTLKGERFSSRYGASLLSAAGCQDFVAESPEEYVRLAAQLSADLPKLRTLRQNLRKMSIQHGLADSKQFARTLENAYVKILANAGSLGDERS